MNLDEIRRWVGPYAADLVERRYGRDYKQPFNPDWTTDRIVQWIGNDRLAARIAHDELALAGMYPRWSSVFVRLPMLTAQAVSNQDSTPEAPRCSQCHRDASATPDDPRVDMGHGLRPCGRCKVRLCPSCYHDGGAWCIPCNRYCAAQGLTPATDRTKASE